MNACGRAVYLVVLLGVATTLHAYVREYYANKPLKRTSNVAFTVGPAVAGGLQNAAGKPVITPESDPIGALNAAMSTWNTVSGVNLNLHLATGRADHGPAGDGMNLITFADTAANRSIVGSAIAVTYYYVLPTQSTIVDSDIIFNPDMTFATTPTLDAFDLQAIATHEIGHAIGAGHTPFAGATMFPYAPPEDLSGRNLSNDDRAFVRDAFPAGPPLGGIRGAVTSPSGTLPTSALVLVLNRETGLCAAPYTAGNFYSTGGLPAGEYFVFAFPVLPELAGSDVSGTEMPDWQSAFYGGVTPATVSVSPGITSQADISVPDGPAKLRIDFAFFGDVWTGVDSRLPSGAAVSVSLIGKGFAADTRPEDITVYGPGVTVRADSIHVISSDDPSVSDELSFTIDVRARADWADLVIVVRAHDLAAAYVGRVSPAGPAFAPSGVVNAASFASGPVAPGEIVTIFGSHIGPDEGVSAVLQPDGALPTALGDTVVEVGGRPAPLLFASSLQINAQVPFEVAGQPGTRIRLRHGDLVAEAILPVAAASPAVFGGWGQPAIFNEDGSLNDPSHPAARSRPVVVYGTGQGLVDPPLATGRLAPGDPLSRAHNVTATVGDKSARVDFAGMAPGYVGLWQVNVVVPDDVPAGFLPLVLTVNDSFHSMPAFISVQ